MNGVRTVEDPGVYAADQCTTFPVVSETTIENRIAA
jgi:hypothetical protein